MFLYKHALFHAIEEHLYLQITGRCNHSCIFCSRPPTEIREDLPLSVIREKLDKHKNVSKVSLTGGEPTLHKDISEIISLARSAAKDVELLTNGQMLAYPDFLAMLKDKGVSAIHFSFHSHEKEISEKLSRTASFDRIRKAIKASLAAGMKTSIVHVVSSLNFEKLPAFAQYCREEFPGLSGINFSLVSPEGTALKNSWIIPRYSAIKPYLHEAMEYCAKNRMQFSVSSTVPLCLVEGYEEYASSTFFLLRKYRIIDETGYNTHELDFNKPMEYAKKAPQCKDCTLDPVCPGFFPNYPHLYGYSDFVPSKKDPGSMRQ